MYTYIYILWGVQTVSQSLYGIAKGGYSSPRLHHYFDMVEEMLVSSAQIATYSEQHIANIAWYKGGGERDGGGGGGAGVGGVKKQKRRKKKRRKEEKF